MRSRTAERVRCDFLLSWVFLVSLVALLVNDFVLKPNMPSAVSGILSDVAGMVFFPILLVAAAESLMFLAPRRRLAEPGWFVAGAGLVGVCFVVVKFTPMGESVYTSVVNPVVQWTGGALSLGTSGVLSDPTDLLALLALPIPILVGRRWRASRSEAYPNGATGPCEAPNA